MENDSERAISLNQQGKDLYAQGDVQAALDAFTQALKADPGLTETHNNMGVLCWERGGISISGGCFN